MLQSKGGNWAVKLNRDIKRWGFKKGDTIRVPQMVADAVALRWIQEGNAETTPLVENKAAKKRQTKAVS